jgi:hypothetical protein
MVACDDRLAERSFFKESCFDQGGPQRALPSVAQRQASHLEGRSCSGDGTQAKGPHAPLLSLYLERLALKLATSAGTPP